MDFRKGLLATVAAGFLLTMPLLAMAQNATGAGSSFADPILQRWIELAEPAVEITIAYHPIGSSWGQNKLLEGSVDFAVSDAPMPAVALSNGELVQFPIAIGAVVCVVNVPGIATHQLQLNGALLAAIYTGKIKSWNDPAIVAVNPGLKLPDLAIRPIWQADVAGTSFAFTQYLLATNAEWREKFGARITKRWAIGASVASNAMMREAMQTLPDSIGYLDYSLAYANKLPMVLLQNKAGKYVDANPTEFAASLKTVKWEVAVDEVINLINLPGDTSWPILTPLYVQMPLKPKDVARSQAARKLFEFAFSQGGSQMRRRNFVPLPPVAQDAARAAWSKLGGG